MVGSWNETASLSSSVASLTLSGKTLVGPTATPDVMITSGEKPGQPAMGTLQSMGWGL